MRKHLKYLRKEKGMTLVELLAVLVILGILAAIAIPLIGNIIQDSRDKATVNEALNIIAAAKLAHTNGENNSATIFEVKWLNENGYLDIDSDFNGVKAEKTDDGWKLTAVNEDIKNAVNNLASSGTIDNEVTEKQLHTALEKGSIGSDNQNPVSEDEGDQG